MTIINHYQNGNYSVTIQDDGTKTREFHETPNPLFPESIDLKITDFCDAGCPFCHESSTKKGLHAKTETIAQIVEGLPPGVEIAIGGGNPLSHPQLLSILGYFRDRGLIANITIHDSHVYENYTKIQQLQNAKLVHGIGISSKELEKYAFSNLVYHNIVGITDPQSILRVASGIDKILVLGYKQFGFGKKHFSEKVQKNIDRWRYWITPIMNKIALCSFDNLAIEQLDVQNKITADRWNESFMGNDGEFTMYIDAVKNEFARSSTSERKPVGEKSIIQMFQEIRSEL